MRCSPLCGLFAPKFRGQLSVRAPPCWPCWRTDCCRRRCAPPQAQGRESGSAAVCTASRPVQVGQVGCQLGEKGQHNTTQPTPHTQREHTGSHSTTSAPSERSRVILATDVLSGQTHVTCTDVRRAADSTGEDGGGDYARTNLHAQRACHHRQRYACGRKRYEASVHYKFKASVQKYAPNDKLEVVVKHGPRRRRPAEQEMHTRIARCSLDNRKVPRCIGLLDDSLHCDEKWRGVQPTQPTLAARSFTLPPGLVYSSLARISQPVASHRLFRRTI
jgi:hypothetical protein